MDIELLIKKAFNSFNSVTNKKKQVKDIKKFILTKNYDSLDKINLYTAFDETLSENGYNLKINNQLFVKNFKNYKTIFSFIKNAKK